MSPQFKSEQSRDPAPLDESVPPNWHNALDYRNAVATLLGCPDERYPNNLPGNVIRRIYHAVLGEYPDDSLTVPELRVAIATELNWPNPERLGDASRTFRKPDIQAIYEFLVDCEDEWLDHVALGKVCPACQHAVATTRDLGDVVEQARVSLTENACLRVEDGNLVEYIHD